MDTTPFADGEGMKHPFGYALSVLILAVSSRAADPDFVVHKRVSEVRMTVIATDAEGRPWPKLSASSLAIADDGVAVSNAQLRSADDLPLRIGIMVDLSDSTRASWPEVRGALTRSMAGLVRAGDQILMVSFNSRIETERIFAAPQDLQEALPVANGGLTALYDALYRSCEHPVFSAGQEPRRSALLLFSDGEDNVSYRGLSETIAAAQRAGISIYTIATHNPNQRKRGDGVLQRISGETGGRDFVVKDRNELQAALETIDTELRGSYLLYFRSDDLARQTAFHRVEVLPSRNAELRLRTPAGYYVAR